MTNLEKYNSLTAQRKFEERSRLLQELDLEAYPGDCIKVGLRAIDSDLPDHHMAIYMYVQNCLKPRNTK